jgi:hypothetical protein
LRIGLGTANKARSSWEAANIVYNLGALASNARPYDWAEGFDSRMADALIRRDIQSVVEAAALGPLMRLAHPLAEHFLPIVYPLGVSDPQDELQFFNAGQQFHRVGGPIRSPRLLKVGLLLKGDFGLPQLFTSRKEDSNATDEASFLASMDLPVNGGMTAI